MFEILGAALEVSSINRLLLNIPFLFLILSILLIIFLVIGRLSKKSIKLQKPGLIKLFVAITLGLAILACLFDYFYFYADTPSPIHFILLIFSLIFILLSMVFCLAFYQKKALWVTFLILTIISTSLICIPPTIDLYQSLYYRQNCDCPDIGTVHIGEKEVKVPCCPQ